MANLRAAGLKFISDETRESVLRNPNLKADEDIPDDVKYDETIYIDTGSGENVRTYVRAYVRTYLRTYVRTYVFP